MNDLTWIGLSDRVLYESSGDWKGGGGLETSMNNLACNNLSGESVISIYVTIGLLCIF